MSVRPYVSLLRALADAGVAFAVAGGFAVVLHGVPRMTFDLDIVVDLAADNLPWKEFADSRVWRSIDGVSVPVVGRALLRRMKLATGREKEAADARLLGETDE